MFAPQGDDDDSFLHCTSSETSEDEDADAPVKSRNVLTATARRAARAVREAQAASSHGFEQDMEDELDATMQSIIQSALGHLSSGGQQQRSGQPKKKKKKKDEKTSSLPGSNVGTSDDGASASDFYDEIYFDSDEGDEEVERYQPVADGASACSLPSAAGKRSYQRKQRFPVLTNEDLFYDPDIDDENELWMANKLRSHRGVRAVKSKSKSTPASGDTASTGAVSSEAAEGEAMQVDDSRGTEQARQAPRSDAHLSCPACLCTLCVDCQRHDLYNNQYRAMFVMNCSVKSDQILRYKPKEAHRPRSKKAKRRQKGMPCDDAGHSVQAASNTVPTAAANDAQQAASTNASSAEDAFHPVTCAQCATEVAVYDRDEIYHFFNVIAGHA